MRSVGIYYRVSTDKQDFASQRAIVDSWIADLPGNKKPDTINEYVDAGISGKTTKRPEFQRMLADAYGNRIDTIIVYRLDRFSRNATDAIRTILSLDEAGVAFVSVTQPVLNLGHDNPFRRTMLAAFAEIAEIERETIVARVKAGLDAARRRGVQLGAPKRINETHAEQARALRAAGRSLREIANVLSISVGATHKLLRSG